MYATRRAIAQAEGLNKSGRALENVVADAILAAQLGFRGPPGHAIILCDESGFRAKVAKSRRETTGRKIWTIVSVHPAGSWVR